MLVELIRSEAIIGLYNPDIVDFGFYISEDGVEVWFSIDNARFKVLVLSNVVKSATYSIESRIVEVDYPELVPMFSRNEEKPVFWQVFDVLIDRYSRRNELCMNCGCELGLKMPKMAICSSEFCGFQAEKYGYGLGEFDEPTIDLLIQLGKVAGLIPENPSDREKQVLLASIRTQISSCEDSQFLIEANSPEKELRFQQLREQYGSIVAYHGSPVKNWIYIIRDGLKHFTDPTKIANGRAFGPGIYCAADEATSRGYAQAHNAGAIHSIVAECEIINTDIVDDDVKVAHIGPNHPYIRVIDDDYISIRKLLIKVVNKVANK